MIVTVYKPRQQTKCVYGLRGIDPLFPSLAMCDPCLMDMDAPDTMPAGSMISSPWLSMPENISVMESTCYRDWSLA